MSLLLLLAIAAKPKSKTIEPMHINSIGSKHELTAIQWVLDGILGNNLFVNPGFENGINNYSIHDSSNGFYGTVESTSVEGEYRSGAGGAKLISGTTEQSVITRLSQDCATIPGKAYMLSFWCKGDGANDAHFFIYDRTTGVSITIEPVSCNNLTTEWKQVIYSFVAPAGATLIRSVLYAPYVVGGTVYYDDLYFGEILSPDVSVAEEPNTAAMAHSIQAVEWNVSSVEPTTFDNNNEAGVFCAITNVNWEVSALNIWADYNPAFESDLANWIKNDSTNGNHGTVSITSVDGEVYSGTKAVKLVASTSTYNTDPWIHRDTTLESNTNYRLTFWCRGDGTHQGYFFIHDKTTNTYITPSDVPTGNTSTTWEKVTYDFTTPEGASNVRIFLESSGIANSIVWFDECSLSKL